ncbi:MAG TPA: serine/threonine-protein kinase [Polyangia bacterium]|nr:serine/threonine-protein kinase [Polyangia bacterium]
MLGQTLGNYRIIGALGRGAMGHVYLAEHTRINRRAAIKVLSPTLTTDPQLVSRFLDEARATSSIRHPGIVEVFDCDVDATGRVYLVMEYLEGRTLAARLEADGPLPWPEACGIARQIALATAAAHREGIVHRDIKPENIFLSAAADQPKDVTVKILDFGIAKLLSGDASSPRRTVPGALLGTPFYMAPEQCDGAEHLDRRADIYSLGCLLFQMIKGEPPFKGTQTREIIVAQMFQPPPPLGPVDPPTPRWLDALVARMLAKQPAMRPATMEVVARVLARANGSSAGRAGESKVDGGLLPRLRRALRAHRPRTGFDVAIVGATAALTLAVGGLWASQGAAPNEKPPVVRPLSVAAVQAQPQPRPTDLPRPEPVAAAPAAPAPPSSPDGGAPSMASPSPPPRQLLPARRASRSARSLPARPARPVVEMDGLVDI